MIFTLCIYHVCAECYWSFRSAQDSYTWPICEHDSYNPCMYMEEVKKTSSLGDIRKLWGFMERDVKGQQTEQSAYLKVQ